MRIVDRDNFARMMQEKASKFPAGDGDEKFNRWSQGSNALQSVGQPFAGYGYNDGGDMQTTCYKRLKDLPATVLQTVFEAMQELEVGRIV